MVILRDKAAEDVEKWLDYKKLSKAKREQKEDSINKLIDYVSDGVLRIGEDCVIKQQLLFPVGANSAIKELEYQPRINIGRLQINLKGVDVIMDMTGYNFAYGATLTGQPKAVIAELDSEDYSVMQSIIPFFM